jgi:hypothetical protein
LEWLRAGFFLMIDPQRRWHYGPVTPFQYPGDDPDPVPITEYRRAALKCIKVLLAVDAIMSGAAIQYRSTRSRGARRVFQRHWKEISMALGLPSSYMLTEKIVADQYSLSKMAISKSISKFIRLAEIKPREKGYNGYQLL